MSETDNIQMLKTSPELVACDRRRAAAGNSQSSPDWAFGSISGVRATRTA
jgi:hypothetical protein